MKPRASPANGRRMRSASTRTTRPPAPGSSTASAATARSAAWSIAAFPCATTSCCSQLRLDVELMRLAPAARQLVRTDAMAAQNRGRLQAALGQLARALGQVPALRDVGDVALHV